ncbi:MAG: TonB-dependent receptor plug domain-containing protein, partial [Flavobacteriales bacterium]|nr:TonB-dependent receptor plug domain-containing protein [Flavobacteriales bacterium]
LVTTGKEVVLEIKLEESVEQLKEVVISANGKKELPNNEMAKVSARTFSLEEVTRYSGGRNDVARLAASFAGVSAPNDSRNDIVVRGNSPTGLLWRIEGIPVPNTNHFSTFGTTGGPVSALNTNLLKTSDFLTSAFPAEYGNANSAVFDIEMRKGNTETTEYTAQLSAFSGLEFMAEGPISKKKGSSFLASYRYGIASLAATGTSATPYYQDFSYKVDLGQIGIGRLSLFGLLGKSSIDFLGSEIDDEDLFANPNQDAFVESSLGLVGAKLVSSLSKTAYLKTSIGVSSTSVEYLQDNYNRNAQQEIINKYRAIEVKDTENRYTLNSVLNKKYNARFNLRTGTTIEVYQMDALTLDRDRRSQIPDNDGDLIPDEFFTFRDIDEIITLSQFFSQGEYKFTDELSLTAGIHTQYLDLTEDLALEPRAAISWQFKPKQRLSIAYGMHSQMTPLPVLFLTERNVNGEDKRTNDKLDFTRSQHYVLGYDRSFGTSWRVKAETYYQSLSDVPVESTSSSYSVINEGADFIFEERGNLVNEGTASNYGVELTIEKFFSKGFYLLATGSIYESQYKGSDGVERSTAFNNQLVGNLLAGREWKVGKAKRNAFTIDTKITSSQGKPFSPIDLDGTRANAGRQVVIEERAFSQRYDNYFRWDLKFGFQLNSKTKKISHKFFIDFQNVLDRENEFVRRYNEVTDEVNTVNQIGFFPDVLYRIQF